MLRETPSSGNMPSEQAVSERLMTGHTMRRGRSFWWLLAGLAGLGALGGCGAPGSLRAADRYERGLVIVLPGVEGKSHLTTSVAKGLADGGVPCAIEIYDWTVGLPWVAPVVNLRNEARNRREARKIAERIIAYQDRYPGRPTYIIGHSGGGGITVWVLEALPPDRQVTCAILLAPAISPDYNLRYALRRTRVALYNFYSPYDVGFLRVGTSVAGTIDGEHTRAAGAVGFTIPWGLTTEERQLYSSKLIQQRYTSKMAESGHLGTHFGWANRRFVAEWLAVLVNSHLETEPAYPADK